MLVAIGLLSFFCISEAERNKENYLYGYLKAIIVWTVLMYGSLEILSCWRLVTTGNLRIFWCVVDIVLLCFILYKVIMKKEKIWHFWKRTRFELSWFTIGIIVLMCLWGISLVFAIQIAPYNWDSLTYHLPRIMHWAQNRTVAHYASNIVRQVTSPPLAEFINLHVYLMTGGSDQYFNLLQCFSYGTCIILVISITKRLSGSRYCGLLAGFLYAAMPIAVAESFTTQNDEYATLWVLAFLYIILDLYEDPLLKWDRRSIEHTVLLRCCIGFGYLTKPSIGFAIVSFAVLLLILFLKTKSRIQDAAGLLVAAAGIIVVIVIPEVGRNLKTFHAFSDPVAGARQLVGTLKPNYVFINFLKNFLYNTPNAYFQTNNFCESIIYWFAHHLNAIIDDPSISEDGRQFVMQRADVLHHNSAVNALLFWSALSITGITIIRYIIVRGSKHKKVYNIKREKLNLMVAVASGISFLLLCIFMRWEAFISRYMMTYFALLCIVVAVMLHQLITVYGMSFLAYAMIGIIVFTGASDLTKIWTFHSQAYNNSKEKSRIETYFYICGEGNTGDYQDIVKEIEARGYHNIGLLTGNDTFEYPLWCMLRGYSCRVEHISVDNMTDIYEDANFTPDCIFVRDWEPELDAYDYAGMHYVRLNMDKRIGTYLLIPEERE